jgi:hypothetical protein
MVGDGWEEVASTVGDWLENVLARQPAGVAQA